MNQTSKKLMSCGQYGLHIFKNPAGTFSYVGSIPEILCIDGKGPYGEPYKKSPIFKTMEEGIKYFEDRKDLLTN